MLNVFPKCPLSVKSKELKIHCLVFLIINNVALDASHRLAFRENEQAIILRSGQ